MNVMFPIFCSYVGSLYTLFGFVNVASANTWIETEFIVYLIPLVLSLFCFLFKLIGLSLTHLKQLQIISFYTQEY